LHESGSVSKLECRSKFNCCGVGSTPRIRQLHCCRVKFVGHRMLI
jgi:hypothetical protein